MFGDDKGHHLVEAPVVICGDEPEPVALVVLDELIVAVKTDDSASYDASGPIEHLECHVQKVASEPFRRILGTGELSNQVRLDDIRPGVDVHALLRLPAQEVLVRDPHALDAECDVPEDPDIVLGDSQVRP